MSKVITNGASSMKPILEPVGSRPPLTDPYTGPRPTELLDTIKDLEVENESLKRYIQSLEDRVKDLEKIEVLSQTVESIANRLNKMNSTLDDHARALGTIRLQTDRY